MEQEQNICDELLKIFPLPLPALQKVAMQKKGRNHVTVHCLVLHISKIPFRWRRWCVAGFSFSVTSRCECVCEFLGGWMLYIGVDLYCTFWNLQVLMSWWASYFVCLPNKCSWNVSDFNLCQSITPWTSTGDVELKFHTF